MVRKEYYCYFCKRIGGIDRSFKSQGSLNAHLKNCRFRHKHIVYAFNDKGIEVLATMKIYLRLDELYPKLQDKPYGLDRFYGYVLGLKDSRNRTERQKQRNPVKSVQLIHITETTRKNLNLISQLNHEANQ